MSMYQSPTRVCVEFLKGSGSGTSGRVIKLNYSPAQVPMQLYGRIDPGMWGKFMAEVEQVASRHPYVVPPSAKQVGGWALWGAIGSVVGFCCFSPDGGSYPQWEAEVDQLVGRWAGSFSALGLQLTFQHTRLFWLQIDVGPPVAVGYAVPSGSSKDPYKPGYEAGKPGYEAGPATY